jgi:hypothetical protein
MQFSKKGLSSLVVMISILSACGGGGGGDPLREYRTPKKLSKLTPEVIHEQETNPNREQEVYS